MSFWVLSRYSQIWHSEPRCQKVKNTSWNFNFDVLMFLTYFENHMTMFCTSLLITSFQCQVSILRHFQAKPIFCHNILKTFKTLPKAQRTRGLSVPTKVTSLGHITSCYKNLEQNSASESWPSFNFKISTKLQLQILDWTWTSKSWLNLNFKILTRPCAQSLNKKLA